METKTPITERHLKPMTARPHIVLVDDDPIFGHLLQKVANNEGIHLTVIASAEQAYRSLPSMDFDVGLIDYDLVRVTGVQLCHYLQREGCKAPVMLVSQLGEIEKSQWPYSVKKSFSKRAGPYSILWAARTLYDSKERKDGH